MKLKNIILTLMACLALTALAQPTQRQEQWEWYMDEVVNDVFVGRNYFEYYYTPSAADMENQRSRGEVTYFLNSPDGLNSKKVRDMIDRLMASYDDIKAVSEWHVTSTTYWKEFRYEKNRFRFSVKRKALDDGTYYVSVTETAGYYKSLGKGKQKSSERSNDKKPAKKASQRSTRDRHAITQEDVDNADETVAALVDSEGNETPVVPDTKQRQRAERERKEALRAKERTERRNLEEQRREQARQQKEAEKQKKAEEKQRKAEEKQKKEEEKRLKQEEEKQRREQARQERREAQREKAAQRNQAAAPQPVESNYHYSDVALWLSEKYDFTQTGSGINSLTMYSTAVKDVEMAKLAIKNALKGSNARMAVPWRLNNDTRQVETGYIVDGHVLVFAIGNDDDGNITLDINEVSNEDFELFKQQLQPTP